MIERVVRSVDSSGCVNLHFRLVNDLKMPIEWPQLSTLYNRELFKDRGCFWKYVFL